MKKIKNSVHAISPDASLILMCIALLIASPVRIFQMIKNMDTTTGFFIDYSNVSITFLYSLLAVAAVLILIFSFLSARMPASVAPTGRRIPLGLASLVFSATLFYDSIRNYLPAQNETATIVQNAQSVSTLHHAHAILAFISCCYFIVFAISYISGSSFHKKLKILSLAPLAWAVIGVLERITVIISIMRVSELFLELIALVFLMVFFLSFARIISGINSESSMWSAIGCGCTATLFIMVYSIPRIMLHLTNHADSIVKGYPVDVTAVGCAIFIVVFMITVLRSGYSVEDVKEMNEEIADAATETITEESTADSQTQEN